ncbi:hypothetical protein QZH36_11310 [Erwinia sp. BC051422]|uniref:hypothetical protein n=1 Tax=Erwinia wuhanensis TaxID=3045167 RepID=UPI0026529B60|nr:hypothetical protein [Erwinia sp. BC051422]MDN8542020.1 hypothetical protein [Erwinia sp. BC051422]
MKYPDYLSSAKRHNHACRVLNEKIEIIIDNELDTDDYKFLVGSLYYLTGYIIECSLKFKIFELSNFGKEFEVNDTECNKVGINYRKQIKTHDFSKLQNSLDSLIGDMNHLSDDEEINALLRSWSPEVRYSNIAFDYSKVKELYKHTNKFLKKM